jgi:hypothetical protein
MSGGSICSGGDGGNSGRRCDGDAVVTGAVSDSAAMISFEFSVPIPFLLLFICLFALTGIGMDW